MEIMLTNFAYRIYSKNCHFSLKHLFFCAKNNNENLDLKHTFT